MTTPFEGGWRERLTRAIDVSMTFVAVIALVSLVLEYGRYLGTEHNRVLQSLDVGVISLFVLDMAVKLAIARQRRAYLRRNLIHYGLLTFLLLWLALAHRLHHYTAVEGFLTALNIRSVTKLYLIIIQVAIAARLVLEAVEVQRKLTSMRFRPARILVGGYVFIILVGALLLFSPAARPAGESQASFVDSLFTATSATCVTGLTVQDTGTYFSPFGQGVILILIQIGGLGLMTYTAFFALVSGAGMDAKDRMVMQDVLNERTMGSVGRLVVYILLLTFSIEALGAALLYPTWHGTMTTGDRVYLSVFHSISAFCNAGFGLFRTSFESYRASIGLNAVIGGLIVLGGLGFTVHRNLLAVVSSAWRKFPLPFSRRNLVEPPVRARLEVHTKIVLITTAALLVGGAILVWLFEHDGLLRGMDAREQVLASSFQSVTARTAGFNTLDTGRLSSASRLLVMFLMFVGASPGSTGGGIKTVAFALLVVSVVMALRKRERFEIFRHGIRTSVINNAVVVAVVALAVVATATVLVCWSERNTLLNGAPLALGDMMFEVISAFGTVGLSTGLTSSLTSAGKVVIILTMLVGRIGPLMLVLATSQRTSRANYDYPEEDVMIG